MVEFIPFPKVPRLSRECVITEKLDGTNASIWIDDFYTVPWGANQEEAKVVASIPHDGPVLSSWLIRAGSRKRFVTPGKDTDNFGFASWVRDNAEELVKLGPGVHYGEWWGKGIQRNYGLDERRFSLLNVGRWINTHKEPEIVDLSKQERAPTCCHVVPELWRGMFSEGFVNAALNLLDMRGSSAAPGFSDPEGVMVYHTAAQQYFKKTFKGDEAGKGN